MPVCRSSCRTSRATSPGSPRQAIPRTSKVDRALPVSQLDVHARRPSGRVPLALGQARRPGAGHRALVRAAAPRQGAGTQRHADVDPLDRLQVLRRQPAAPAGSRRPADDAELPGVRRGQAGVGRLRRDRARVARRDPAGHRRRRAAGCRHLLRRARVRRGRPAAFDARRQGRRERAGAVRRHGQARDVQHVHALDARPAVSHAAPRSATCRNRSSASSSTRRTCSSTTHPMRSCRRSSGLPG